MKFYSSIMIDLLPISVINRVKDRRNAKERSVKKDSSEKKEVIDDIKVEDKGQVDASAEAEKVEEEPLKSGLLGSVSNEGEPMYVKYPSFEDIYEAKANKIIHTLIDEATKVDEKVSEKKKESSLGLDLEKKLKEIEAKQQEMQELNKWPFDEPYEELLKASHQMRQLVNVCVLLETNEKFALTNISKGFHSHKTKIRQTFISAKKQKI